MTCFKQVMPKYRNQDDQYQWSVTQDWIGLNSVLCPYQHSIGYMGVGFSRSKDLTNSIKVLKEQKVHREIKHTISKHKTQTGQSDYLPY